MELFFHTQSAAETERFAARCAAVFPLGTTFALHGNLGAGKSVFARGFARALGITEHICSPTFTILQQYTIPSGGILAHFDLYRINGDAAALDFGMDEYLADPEVTSLVEWSEQSPGLFDAQTIHLYLERTDVRRPDDDEPRVIRVCGPDVIQGLNA